MNIFAEVTIDETGIIKQIDAVKEAVKTEKSKTALMNMEAELKNVNEQLKDNKLEKFATACDTAGTKMESFGKKMSVVSAGIAGIGAASIKAFTELDEGYDTIVTKTGATGEALEGLTKSADNVFGTMPEDMSTVGEAIGEVNTRFHTTGTELEKTSKQFVQFASINGTNVTQSVDQVDKIMKAWNVDASQTGNLLGLLTAKAQETGISVDTLEGYVLDNNAQFKEMGLSLPQAINLMAQFDASGDVIVKVADKETLDRTYANTNAILAVVGEDVRVKGVKRYGLKINKNDSNPATRCTYLFDAVGMTPAAMNYSTGAFDFGDWGDVFFVKNNYPAMVRYDGTDRQGGREFCCVG